MNSIAALDSNREVFDDPSLAKGLADRLGLDHQPARFFSLRCGKVGAAGIAAIAAACTAQGLQIGKPPDVALATAGDAVAQPMLLADDLAIELVLLPFFLRQYLVAPGLEGGKAAIDLPDLAAIEPGGRAREIGQQAPVMTDQDQRAAATIELALQPFDRR